jgi:hypothetical protein
MTKRIALFAFAIAILLVGSAVAQTAATPALKVDDSVVAGIMALFGIGVLGIIQTLKSLLKWDGTKALIIAAAVSLAATGAYLAIHSIFTVIAWLIYSAIVFGEASGLYKLIVSKPTT